MDKQTIAICVRLNLAINGYFQSVCASIQSKAHRVPLSLRECDLQSERGWYPFNIKFPTLFGRVGWLSYIMSIMRWKCKLCDKLILITQGIVNITLGGGDKMPLS